MPTLSDGMPPLPEPLLRRLLLRCVLGAAGSPAGAERRLARWDMRSVVERASYHKVLPAIVATLPEVADLDPVTAAQVAAEHIHALHVRRAAAADLALAARALGRSGVRWLLVKGLALGHSVYPRPELRMFTDVDLVVEAPDLGRAVLGLEGLGAQLLDHDWTLLVRELRGQLHLSMPRGTLVDLHWHLLNRASVRRAFSVSTAVELARARPLVVAGTPVHTLDSASTLVHLCLHAALSGGDRLGWLVDIHHTVLVLRPGWAHVVARATAWRARLAVGAMLQRAADVLGTPVPVPVLEGLMPAGRRLAVRTQVALSAPGGPGGISPSTVLLPLLRDAGLGLSPRLRRRLPARAGPPRAAGSPVSREHFLARVAAAD